MTRNNVLKKTGTLRKTKKSEKFQIISDLQNIFNYKPRKERLEQHQMMNKSTRQDRSTGEQDQDPV